MVDLKKELLSSGENFSKHLRAVASPTEKTTNLLLYLNSTHVALQVIFTSDLKSFDEGRDSGHTRHSNI